MFLAFAIPNLITSLPPSSPASEENVRLKKEKKKSVQSKKLLIYIMETAKGP